MGSTSEGQYDGIYDFELAIGRVMEIRNLTRRFGIQLFCHRNILQAKVTSTMTIYDVVQRLGMNRRRAIMPWLTRQGPFWDDNRHHGSNEYFECNNNIVTDSAVGEAAFCCQNKIDRGLISFIPSSWKFSPVIVDHVIDDEHRETVHIQNFWNSDDLEQFLKTNRQSIRSWEQLKNEAKERYSNIFFSENAFVPLKGHAFSRTAAERLLVLFNILSELIECYDEKGKRTRKGHEIYQNFFTGKSEGGGSGSLFSDSSDQEKNEFKKELTFPHPENQDQFLFCTWHGKVQTPQLRVHFSWPIRADETFYVVYVGPKITKR